MTEEPATPDSLRILFLGDIFGEPGRRAVIDHLPTLRERFRIDFTIVNGENSAGGRGITPKISISLLRAGATVITLGDHAWDQPEIMEYMPTEPRLLRPLNYPPGAPGHGHIVLDTPKGRVGVLNAQGRVFMSQALDNPFLTTRAVVDEMLADGVRVVFVDFHAEATSEKIAFGRSLEGLATAVVGTHTHVQTSDEIVFPGGTAYLTDAGMCGPLHSVIGSDPLPIIHRFCTNLPTRNHVARGDIRLSGCVIEADPATGRARRIERISEIVSVPS